jgi:RimJ/RimL family protein N-acetyltransferase
MKYKILSLGEYELDNFKITTIDKQHIQLIRKWRNQQINILRQTNVISEVQQNEYFNYNIFPLLESETPVQILFNCYYENKFVGYGGIVHISYSNKIGEISFLLNPEIKTDLFYDFLFTSFLKLMDIIAFSEVKLLKLYTETYSNRIEHVAILEKFGYRLEGVRRSHLIINEKSEDIYMHAKFAI